MRIRGEDMKLLFICHGNICRSPMAEFVMKDLVKKSNLQDQFTIDSCATSTEEIGRGMHSGTKRILEEKQIPYTNHVARQLTKQDYQEYDFLICMDQANIRNTLRIIQTDSQNKVRLLLERDIRDPWYTGNFEETYTDVLTGCTNLLNELTKK